MNADEQRRKRLGLLPHEQEIPALANSKYPGLMSPADFAKLATLQVPVSRLSYTPGADLLTAAAIAASTWTDVHANQNFTVGSATAGLLLLLRCAISVTAAGGNSSLGLRAVFNSAGTPINVMLGGGNTGAAGAVDSLHGTAIWLPPAFLPTGTNTVKVQLISGLAATASCRPVTGAPNTEPFNIRILELHA